MLHRSLDDDDRTTLKRCFFHLDAKLRSILLPEKVRKLHCIIRDRLNMNPYAVLRFPEVDAYFATEYRTDSNNETNLVCTDFNFTSLGTKEVIDGIGVELDMLKDYFESAERSEQFHNASACVTREMSYTLGGNDYGREYEKSRSDFLQFYSRVKGKHSSYSTLVKRRKTGAGRIIVLQSSSNRPY